MINIDFEQEKNMIDYVGSSMQSLDILEGMTNIIFSKERNAYTVGQFYDKWMEESGAKDVVIPYSLGAILGCLFCGIVLTKANWDYLLPNGYFNSPSIPSGLSGAPYKAPIEPTPDLKYVIRRIRNALAHGNFNINVPKGINKTNAITRVTIYFHDKKNRRPEDYFDITLTLKQLSDFIRYFHSLIYKSIRSRI